jgi:hypothetical protein
VDSSSRRIFRRQASACTTAKRRLRFSGASSYLIRASFYLLVTCSLTTPPSSGPSLHQHPFTPKSCHRSGRGHGRWMVGSDINMVIPLRFLAYAKRSLYELPLPPTETTAHRLPKLESTGTNNVSKKTTLSVLWFCCYWFPLGIFGKVIFPS